MILTRITPKDDGFFGEELRLEGMDLVTTHQKLEDDRRYVWMNGKNTKLEATFIQLALLSSFSFSFSNSVVAAKLQRCMHAGRIDLSTPNSIPVTA